MAVTSSQDVPQAPANAPTACGRFQSLASLRLNFLDTARYAAELTIPTLVPPEGHGPHTKYYTPFQGIGARGVNNLASKLLLTLYPPNSPFFRLKVDPFLLKRTGADEKLKTEMDKALAEIEKAVQDEVESAAIRVSAFEALRQLLVAGNVLLHIPKEGNLRVFRLDSYVVKRDMSGNLLEIVIEESVSPSALSKEIRDFYGDSEDFLTAQKDGKDLRVYTQILRKPDNSGWTIHQEICGRIVPESEGNYGLDKLPYLALRFSRIDGEDYGRGYVEEYIGDLRSLEAMSQAIVEASAACSRILFLVRPNSVTRTKTIADAANGSVVTGDAADVTTMRVDKMGDFQITKATVDKIEERLAHAFLLNSSIQRNAERVTAEEIRFMAQELESSLGGTYSILSQEFQLPLVDRLMDRMQAAKRLPRFRKKLVRPVIVTGVEALGRGNDLNKLDMFVAGMAQTLGPQVISQFLNINEYLQRRATALGLDLEGLLNDPQEMEALAQQSQQQALLEKLGPQGIRSLTDMATKGNPEMLNQLSQQQ